MMLPWFDVRPDGWEVGLGSDTFARWERDTEHFCMRVLGVGFMVRNRAKALPMLFSERLGFRRSWVVSFLSRQT